MILSSVLDMVFLDMVILHTSKKKNIILKKKRKNNE